MKTSVKIIIAAGLFILLAGSVGICIHHSHKNKIMRSMNGRAYFQPRGMNQSGMRGNNRMADMPMRNAMMRPGMEAGQMGGMRRNRNMGEMNGMGRGRGPGRMAPMAMDRMGRGNMGPGIVRNIPDLTEKQKKELVDLRQKQLDEMKKLRDDITKKRQSLKEIHQKKVMDLLTAEQKKFIESNNRIVKPEPSK